MCRLAAYNGPARPLASLTHEPPHALLVQSYRPREMREALLNADGVGAAWYPDDGDARPCRYRHPGPMWSDENLEALAPRVCSRTLLAVVRSATPGLEVGPANTPPYVHGSIAFMHNGYLESFRKRFMRPMRDLLSDPAHEVLIGGTDSEHVFALLLDALAFAERPSGEALAVAVRKTIGTCTGLAERAGARAVMNLVASNGAALVATRYSSSGPTATLYSLEDDSSCTIASEPLSPDAGWREVPEDTMLVVESGRLRAERLR